MRAWRRGTLLAGLTAGLILLAGCTGPRSADPQIKLEQDFVASCAQMEQGVRTGITLRKAGTLSETEIQVIGLVKTVYVGICSSEPQPAGDTLKDAAVLAAVGELCPELSLDDDITITIAMASVCAARQYLLKHMEVSS